MTKLVTFIVTSDALNNNNNNNNNNNDDDDDDGDDDDDDDDDDNNNNNININCRVQWLRGKALDSRLREPGFESCTAVLKILCKFFSLYIAPVHSAE